MRRKALSNEEMALIGNAKPLTDEDVVEQFMKSRLIRNIRPATIDFYTVALRVYRRTLNELGIDKPFIQTVASDVHIVIEHWLTTVKPSTINSKLTAIRAFYNFLYQKKYIADDVAADVHKLRTRTEIYDTLERNEIRLIAAHLKKQGTFRAFRNLAIFQLLLDTGVRINECLHIKVSDIHGDYIVVAQTKNLSQRIVYLSDSMIERLKIYVNVRGELATPYLFVNYENDRIKSRSFQEHLKAVAKECGIKKNVSPHMCRRTYAKQAVIAGIDPFSLASLLGHSSVEVTKRYVQLWGSDLKNQAKLKADYGDIF